MSERRRYQAAQPKTIASRLRRLVLLCWAMLLIVCFTAAGVLAAQSDNIQRLTLIDGRR